MLKSRSRSARAHARARYRKPPRRRGSVAWGVGLASIIAVGVVLIAFTVKNRHASASGIKLSDHWHAALGVNICGSWEPNQPEFVTRPSKPSVHAGLHTHGDGLIHMEPQNSGEIGNRATLRLFADYGEWKLSRDSVQDWTHTKKKNGDECPDGKVGAWKWGVNHNLRHGNPADYKPRNGDVIVLAFVPKGDDITKLGDPPSTARLATPEGRSPPAETVPPVPRTAPTSTALPPPS